MCINCHKNKKYIIKNDILYINGKESYIPGILEKTLFAFSLFRNDYDYIIRTNVSSIINVDKIMKILQTTKIEYGCGHCLKLSWLDKLYGIIDTTYWNTNYAQGTCIILSKNAINELIENQNDIPYGIIDDVAIGYMLKKYKLQTFTNIFYRHKPENYENINDITKIITDVKTKCNNLLQM